MIISGLNIGKRGNKRPAQASKKNSQTLFSVNKNGLSKEIITFGPNDYPSKQCHTVYRYTLFFLNQFFSHNFEYSL